MVTEPSRDGGQRTPNPGSRDSWGDHHACLFSGTEKFFRPGYKATLVPSWLPALDGVVAKLKVAPQKVTNVGCAGTSHVDGDHGPGVTQFAVTGVSTSTDRQSERGSSSGADRSGRRRDRVRGFEQADAKDYREAGFDLVCFFDCLRDMGDPVGTSPPLLLEALDGAMAPCCSSSRSPGTPAEDDTTWRPSGCMLYATSTFIPVRRSSASRRCATGLGAQAGRGCKLRPRFRRGRVRAGPAGHGDTVQPHSRSTQSRQRDVRGADVVVLAALRVEASTLSPHAPRRRLLTPGPLAQHLGRHSQTRSLTQPATTTLPRPRTVPEGCRRVLDPLRERHRLGQAQQESSTQVGRGSTTISRTSSNRRSRTPCLGPDARDYPMPLPALLGGP